MGLERHFGRAEYGSNGICHPDRGLQSRPRDLRFLCSTYHPNRALPFRPTIPTEDFTLLLSSRPRTLVRPRDRRFLRSTYHLNRALPFRPTIPTEDFTLLLSSRPRTLVRPRDLRFLRSTYHLNRALPFRPTIPTEDFTLLLSSRPRTFTPLLSSRPRTLVRPRDLRFLRSTYHPNRALPFRPTIPTEDFTLLLSSRPTLI